MSGSSRPQLAVSLTVAVLCIGMALLSDTFASPENAANVTRNVAFIGLVALGQTLVILTGGIDLSVGSVMGLSGVVAALVLESGQPLVAGLAAGLGVALLCGLLNGCLVAYLRLPPFVVTLGTLAIARSLALAISQNRMIHDLGPEEGLLVELGGGSLLGLATPAWILLGMALVTGFVLRARPLGRHLYAIGGNESAARANGVPVERVKLTAYAVSAGTAGLASLLVIGWLGAVTNALGQTWELRVIAAAVIGGASLSGGEGGAYGALIGAALIEVVRNALLLAGVDPFWQGTFVGGFIILAVVLERLRRGRA